MAEHELSVPNISSLELKKGTFGHEINVFVDYERTDESEYKFTSFYACAESVRKGEEAFNIL